MFQTAAGIFTTVSAPLPASTTEQKPTPDLSSDCATALSSLCLAQAQEIVLKKAVGDSKKESVLAKISEQTAAIAHDASAAEMRERLEALSKVGTVAVGRTVLPSTTAAPLQREGVRERERVGLRRRRWLLFEHAAESRGWMSVQRFGRDRDTQRPP